MEDYTTEFHNIEEFLPHEMQQDACWWYQNFSGFEEEMYAILEYIDKDMEDVIHEFLENSFKVRQDRLRAKFENGGRKPHEEEMLMTELIYLTKDKVDELDSTRNIFE